MVLSSDEDTCLTRSLVWQIAQRDYKFGKGKHRSLTKATYDAIGDHFRTLWGKEAGWAHSVLFAADLRAFSEKLSTKIEIKEECETTQSSETIPKVKIRPTNLIKRELDDDSSLAKAEDQQNSRKAKRRKRS